MADSEEVLHLLQIVEQASKHGDVLKPIADHAMNRLRQLAEEHKPRLKVEPPKVERPSLLRRSAGEKDE